MSRMSPPRPYTAKSVAVSSYNPSANDDEDIDLDLCPVCDGECTCNNNKPPPARVFLAPAHENRTNVHAPTPEPTPSTSAPPTPKLPSLKIKLTVPPSLLDKRRATPSSKHGKHHQYHQAVSNVGASTSSQPPPIVDLANMPKRRGRPTKAVVAARLAAAAQAGFTPSQAAARLRQPAPKKIFQAGKTYQSTLPRPKFPPRGTTDKKGKKKQVFVPKKRRRVVSSGESSSSSDSSDDELHGAAASDAFPTFVSASAISSSGGSSSDSSSDGDDSSSPLSEFDSDDSIAEEEESFIVSEEARTREKARVKRELLGDEGKRRDQRNGWVIRSRIRSEGPSDEEMAVDTDATEDDEEQGMEADEEEEEEDDDDDEDGSSRVGEGYVGLATGWSDDEEESSFDADLFFASLEASDDDKDTPDANDSDATMSVDEDEDAAARDNMPFELAEGWNGELLFTNGALPSAEHLYQLEFETTDASAAPTSPSPSQSEDMDTTEGEEDGYEQDVDAYEGEGEGDTTDEELVGEDDLPNERAMQIFSFPPSVSAINPLSTMSPVVSRTRPRLGAGVGGVDSLRPADILAGRALFGAEFPGDESDEFDEPDVRSPSHGRSTSSGQEGPREGAFEMVVGTKHVVIDDAKNNIPSPHPRIGRGRGRGRGISVSSLSGLGPAEGMEAFLRQLPSLRPSSVPAPARLEHVFSGSESEVLSPEPFRAPMQLDSAFQDPANFQEPIELDDVLDSSFMDAESPWEDASGTDDAHPGDGRHLKSLRRWDLISVGAFRQSHGAVVAGRSDAPGWTSDTGDLSGMIRASPMRHHLLWEDTRRRAPRLNQSRRHESPDRNGDRTPTQGMDTTVDGGQQSASGLPSGIVQSPTPNTNSSPSLDIIHHLDANHLKTRKQLRQERKMKGKALAAQNQQQQQYSRGHRHHLGHQVQKHQRQHHPNNKSRPMNGVQRGMGKGFGSSSPVPSI
ncbi:uncharacterized protein SCHCODRAFT_02217359 [Schizophyllum commune H4-8]|uniref:uncharacterized protein n=1 Tax=Schizophyllum commune (strain H4-8 / FGSC 9210) TaxID=578458 RepID=UPI0021606E14|nr:uncharacterized protein SCHCODRAFT_02217359 [Schizophyllum commune H4-8]KAI5894853.1 hypothetical protein SCHCODRAFT_02217359 [Schizophyllum commune H4-8]